MKIKKAKIILNFNLIKLPFLLYEIEKFFFLKNYSLLFKKIKKQYTGREKINKSLYNNFFFLFYYYKILIKKKKRNIFAENN
jgi:hypothetical protein